MTNQTIEEIKKQAEIAESWIESFSDLTLKAVFVTKEDSRYCNTAKALIAAARLLEQVEVVEGGEEPRVGDMITHLGIKAFSILDIIYGQNGVKTYRCYGEHILAEKYKDYKIIQRAGKPCITLPKEIAE